MCQVQKKVLSLQVELFVTLSSDSIFGSLWLDWSAQQNAPEWQPELDPIAESVWLKPDLLFPFFYHSIASKTTTHKMSPFGSLKEDLLRAVNCDIYFFP